MLSSILVWRKLFHAFDFQPPYRRARLFPYQGEVQMSAEGSALMRATAVHHHHSEEYTEGQSLIRGRESS